MRLKDDEQRALLEIASGADAMDGVSTQHAFAILRKLIQNNLLDEGLSLTKRGQHVVAKLTKKNALTTSESKSDGTAIQGQDGPRMDDRTDGTVSQEVERIAFNQLEGSIDGPATEIAERSDDADRSDWCVLPDAD